MSINTGHLDTARCAPIPLRLTMQHTRCAIRELITFATRHDDKDIRLAACQLAHRLDAAYDDIADLAAHCSLRLPE